jgi:hypothetical protein
MKSLFLYAAILMSITVSGQEAGRVAGYIRNQLNQPIEGATASLIKVSDSTVVRNSLSGSDGKFLIEQVIPGSYRLQVSHIGYKTFRGAVIRLSAGQSPYMIPDIVLARAEVALAVVEIQAGKRLVEQKIDRTIINVDALIANAGVTALDVLGQSPGIQVDQNGGISLRGKSGVQIFIDDKPTYLSGNDLATYLQSLPSGTLDQIEIMPNPPAKYDAAGGAGIINIKTKRSKLKGFNGSLSLGLTQGRLTKSSNSLNFNYRTDKLSISGNAGYSYQNLFTELDVNRRFQNQDYSLRSELNQDSHSRRTGQPLLLKIGIDYYIDPKTTVGFMFSEQFSPLKVRKAVTNHLLSAAGAVDSIIRADNLETTRFNNGSYGVNFRRQFKKNGPELTAEADYVSYSTELSQGFQNTAFYPDETIKSSDLLTGYLPLRINILAGRSNYVHPLGKGAQIEAGWKSSYTKTDNLADYRTVVNSVSQQDYNKSNHFLYNEYIHAAHMSLSKEGRHFSLQTGLRLENTVSSGYQSGNQAKPDSSFKRSYLNLFPTAYLLYKPDTASVHVVRLSYGKRINRPYYQDLNPFISPLDKFTYYVGNPFLRPSFTHIVELGYTMHSRYTIAVSWSGERNKISETIEIKEGIFYSRPGNIGVQNNKVISADATFDPFQWLNIRFYAQVTNRQIKGTLYGGTINTRGTWIYVAPLFSAKFKKAWTAELNANYQGPAIVGQLRIGDQFAMGAAIRKDISTTSSFRIAASDIFYTQITRGTFNNLYFTKASFRNRRDSRTLALVYSWRFGKTFASQKKYENQGAQEEQERVKN